MIIGTRVFNADGRFFRGLVIKTPFRGDVARVYFRTDNRVVVQFGGTFRPLVVSGDTPVSATLSAVSDMLDNWDLNN